MRKVDRIFKMWIVNVESGSYFSKVERKFGKWIVFLIVGDLGTRDVTSATFHSGIQPYSEDFDDYDPFFLIKRKK
jgi:hypothetical protein